jgi:cellulose synthase/poly-beta-1,6-N-acetylglucosamine synthase-like glycosyltransferase
MQNTIDIFYAIMAVFGTLLTYDIAFTILGLIAPSKKFKKSNTQYKYAVLIPARNEEKSIPLLLDSLKKQDYPADKLSVFVVAHNCTDNTAEIARNYGATVYEYDNSKERSKGFALKYLVKKIKEDNKDGIYSFDGYFLIDADVVVETNYITEMNNAFDNKRYDFYTSYVSAKNADASLSAGLRGMSSYRMNLIHYRPKSILGISPGSLGMCWLVKNYMLHDGYKSVGFADDIEFSLDAFSKGYRSTFVASAIFYTEVPGTYNSFLKQHIRWVQSTLFAFLKYFIFAIGGMFIPRDWRAKKEKREKIKRPKQNFFMTLLEQIQKRISCLDIFINALPIPFLAFITFALFPISLLIFAGATGNITGVNQYLLQILYIFLANYLASFISFVLCFVRERKYIRSSPKILLNVFIWPLIEYLLVFVNFAAYFMPHKWWVMKRNDKKKIEDIQEIPVIADFGGTKNKSKYISVCVSITVFGVLFSIFGVCLILRRALSLFEFLSYMEYHTIILMLFLGLFTTCFGIWKLFKLSNKGLLKSARFKKNMALFGFILLTLVGLALSILGMVFTISTLQKINNNLDVGYPIAIPFTISGILIASFGMWKLIADKVK